MGVREIDRFLEQWQMDARDLHRPFQMHHSFSVAIYAIPGSMAGVVVVCAGPSRAMPSLWAAATYLRTVILGKAGAHRDLPLAVPRLPTAEVRQWSPTRLPEWTNDPENLAGIPRAAFVITMTKPRTRLGRQIDAALAELGLPVLNSRTSDRVAYTHAGNEGTSVIEGPDRTARDEILAIRRELEQLTHEHQQPAPTR